MVNDVKFNVKRYHALNGHHNLISPHIIRIIVVRYRECKREIKHKLIG